ncbi:MAG: PepSY domain-containing protein [Prosthecobacter sp.]|uniref:PepSY domain-containing protein n=1 Tax=Prosthecobacter sp. TaxID=1965333 RepID=UPI003903AD26
MLRYDNLQLSLHIGAIGGTATRWIALFVCVALVLQIFGGYVLWWKRAPAQAKI